MLSHFPHVVTSTLLLYRSTSFIHKAPSYFNLRTMMNRFLVVLVALVALLSSASAFAPGKTAFPVSRVAVSNAVRPSQLSMIFGGPKDDGKDGDYVCLVRMIAVTFVMSCVFFPRILTTRTYFLFS